MGEDSSLLIPQHHPKKFAKEARQSGRAYISKTGKYVNSKYFTYHACKCKYECSDLPEEERKLLSHKFYKMCSWQAQSNFILSNVVVKAPKRSFVSNSRKLTSRVFYLNGKRVCKEVFLRTLGITHGRLDYVLNHKAVNSTMCSPDKRGKHHSNRTPSSKISEIRQFLSSFPKYKSHYSDSERVYFSPDLNRNKLYSLYKDQMKDTAVSRPIFYKCFKEFNVAFYVPKADTCKFCDESNINIAQATNQLKTTLQTRLEEHHHEASTVRNNLKSAVEAAKSDPSVLVFTFDMQQTAPLPRLNTSVVFYKRQLWIYNTGIHTCHDDRGYMMLWLEGQGRKGSAEICSCIYEFLKNRDLLNIRKIITFSDSCGSQNRNKTIICFIMYVCYFFNIDCWEHSYMESGHSYLPNDRGFGVISKRAKLISTVYDLDQWIDVIKTARVKDPFVIKEMAHKFVDVENLSSLRKYCPTATDAPSKFNFLKLKWFRVKKNSDTVEYRLKQDRPIFNLLYPLKNPCSILEQELKVVNRSVNISKEKYKDLMSMMSLIPDSFKDFYRNLPHD